MVFLTGRDRRRRIDSNARDSLADAQRFFDRIFVITVHTENGVRAELHPTGRLVEYSVSGLSYTCFTQTRVFMVFSALLKPIAYLYNEQVCLCNKKIERSFFFIDCPVPAWYSIFMSVLYLSVTGRHRSVRKIMTGSLPWAGGRHSFSESISVKPG
jgi:hypothetical protein